MRFAWQPLLAFVSLAACSHTAALGPGMNAKRQANLVELAAAQTGCAATGLTPKYVKSVRSNVHLYAVDGCGQHFEALLECLAGMCRWEDAKAAEKRAAFDLQCPVEQVTRVDLPGAALGMSGCGRTITYIVVDGQLVANSTMQSQPRPAPAPKPGTPVDSL